MIVIWFLFFGNVTGEADTSKREISYFMMTVLYTSLEEHGISRGWGEVVTGWALVWMHRESFPDDVLKLRPEDLHRHGPREGDGGGRRVF